VVLLVEASCSTEVTSDTVGALSLADTLGNNDFAEEEVAETTCVKEESDSSFSKRGVRTSGSGSVY
jgi:hypothetical protein